MSKELQIQQRKLDVQQRNHFTTTLSQQVITNDAEGLSRSIREIMPGGVPDFAIIPLAPSIKQLVASTGYDEMRTIIYAIVSNFCDSVNVPEGKNMSTAQVSDAVDFLLDECGNFRIEDYVMMFTLGKRGKLKSGATGRIFDRVDIHLISEFKANYEQMRAEEGYKLQERQVREIENGNSETNLPSDPVRESNFKKAMDELTRQLTAMAEERDAESEKRKQHYQKRKEELFLQIQELAQKNGYEGDLIDLSPFKRKT